LRMSQLARQLSAPVPVKATARNAANQVRRDVYLIILDEYANSNILRERFGFDDRLFVDSLRHLGFTIPRAIHSNYVHTLLSVPSLLNFSHLTSLESELGPRNTDPTLPNYLVENNRTTAFLKAQGYRFLFFPSQWWISTEHNRNADWEFRAWDRINLLREVTRSDLRRAFIGTTPLALLYRNDAFDADYVRRILEGIEQVPLWREPTFTFAHILNPHYPYVFDAACRPLKRRPTAGWSGGRRDAYVGQVQCLNTLVLRTISNVVQRSAVTPIILLVGDHGSNSLRYSDAPTAAQVSPAQARERFGAFAAFLLPGNPDPQLTDSLTLVNLIPKVLNTYFGAGIPLAPDKLYMSLEKTPYAFAEVEQGALAQ
jgi:hypothetical protein